VLVGAVAICVFSLLPAAPASATPIFTENFNSATSGALVVTGAEFSELWVATDYYLSPASTGWSFSASGAFLAVNHGDPSNKAILLNEGPAHGTAATGLTLVPGQWYNLTFDHWGDNRPGTNNYVFDVMLDSTPLGTVNRGYGAPGPGATTTFSFRATASSQTLSFSDNTLSGEASGIIDNISVTAVPEPTSLLLLGAGLSALGLVKRRKA
jgi:hypothetical protein